MVDTVHGFQGDERDVIFFSPVVSAGISDSTLRFLKSHGDLFNVAITRARSEVVVVGNMQAALDSGSTTWPASLNMPTDCGRRKRGRRMPRRPVRSIQW